MNKDRDSILSLQKWKFRRKQIRNVAKKDELENEI